MVSEPKEVSGPRITKQTVMTQELFTKMAKPACFMYLKKEDVFS